MLEFRFFGPPQIRVGGQLITTLERKPIALLAYLAVTGRPHTREHLAALFWPDHEPTRARANLRYVLWMLRKFLGERYLSNQREQVAFVNPAPMRLSPANHSQPRNDESVGRDGVKIGVKVDVLRFCALLEAGRSAGSESTLVSPHAPAQAQPAHLEEAVALYTEDFLAGFDAAAGELFEEWLFFTREALRGQLAQALAQLSRHYAEDGDIEAAIEITRRHLALDALNEPVHRRLMELFAASGQWTAALRQYAHCARVLGQEVNATPDAETQELYDRIRSRQLDVPGLVLAPTDADKAGTKADARGAADATAPPVHLPVAATPFVGRRADLDAIGARLADSDCRLLSLVGSGGVGKSRLAIEASREIAAARPSCCTHGIFFVALETVEAPALLADAILTALDIARASEIEARQQLLDYLSRRELLLVLDNFDHLVGATDLPQAILKHAPGVKCLVTCRERLNLREEWFHPVGGMQNEKLEDDAFTLFRLCARRLGQELPNDTESKALVAQLCTLVGGMPLAIELAAGWLPLLPLGAVVEEIKRRLAFLTTTLHNMPDRHRSLPAVFDTSWGMLTPTEQAALCRLAVFRGGFTRAAAEAVGSTTLLELLSFTNKSWLAKSGPDRYALHPLIRQYLLEKLEENYRDFVHESAHSVRDRHAAYFADFLAQRQEDFYTAQQKTRIDECLEEIDNIRVAWEWAAQRARCDWLGQSAEAIWVLSHARGRFQEGVHSLDRAATQLWARLAELGHDPARNHRGIAAAPTDQTPPQATSAETRKVLDEIAQLRATVATLRCWQGWLSTDLGLLEQAHTLCVQALGILEDPAWDRRGTQAHALAHLALGWATYHLGRYQESGVLYDHALAYFAKQGPAHWQAVTQMFLGLNQLRQGRPQEGQQRLASSLAYWEQNGDHALRSSCLRLLGQIAMAQGDYASATENSERALAAAHASGMSKHVSHSYLMLGDLMLAMGQYGAAQRHYEAGDQLAQESADRLGQVAFRNGLASVAAGREHFLQAQLLFSENLDLCLAMGRRRDAAIAYKGLGQIATAQEEYAVADAHYLAGLKLAEATGDVIVESSIRISQAELYLQWEKYRMAAEELERVRATPAAGAPLRDRAQALLQMLQSQAIQKANIRSDPTQSSKS